MKQTIEARPRQTGNQCAGVFIHHLRPVGGTQEYRVVVGLPNMPVDAARRLPVIYATDGDMCAGMVVDQVRFMQMAGDLPPSIVVAIGYPLETATPPLLLRNRDLVPTPSPGFDAMWSRMLGIDNPVRSGEADKFLHFICSHLQPFVAGNYPADPDDATLIGASFGGLFAAHALFTAPDSFQRYCLISPSLWWDRRRIFETEAAYARMNDTLAKRVFICAGELESQKHVTAAINAVPEPARSVLVDYYDKAGWPMQTEPMEEFVGIVRSRGYAGLHLASHIFDKEGHASVPAVGLSWGLRYLFGRLDIGNA